MTSRYYEDKLDVLRDIFGADVSLEKDRVIAGERVYPVVDDVIVCLEPRHHPPGLRRRLGAAAAPPAGGAGFAPDIQATFGAEWTAYPEILPEHEAEFRLYFDIVDLDRLRGRRVCDLGCGIGRWSTFLAPVARELVLVDFSEAIFVARRNLAAADRAVFVMADIRNLPFRDDFADFLFCLGVLHHLPTDALDEVRALRRWAPELLIYLYWALDGQGAGMRALLAAVTAARTGLSRVENAAFRSAFAWFGAAFVYAPLVGLGHAASPLGLAHKVPLFAGYRGKSLRRMRQDVYDRFFTRIEQRVSRAAIGTLTDTFRQVVVSDGLPYWHFLCRR